MSVDAEQWDIVTSVGLTALGVAAARAIESERGDALVRDPLAGRFVAAADAPTALPTTRHDPGADSIFWRVMADFLAVRSRYLDDVVSEAVAAGVTQIVVLAAGLDVRAQRLAGLEECTLYEVDQPRVLAFKQDVLSDAGVAAGCDRRLVPTDLREDWPAALARAGHDAARPTVWLAEGLLPYLPATAEELLFDRITALSAPRSRVGVEFVHDVEQVLRTPLATASIEELGVGLSSLWSSEPRETADAGLTRRGWTGHAETSNDAAARFRRELDPVTVETLGAYAVLGTFSR